MSGGLCLFAFDSSPDPPLSLSSLWSIPRDLWLWMESFRGLLFAGMEDMRRGMIGGWASRMLRLGLRCLSVGRDGPGVGDGGRGCVVGERADEPSCDGDFTGLDLVRDGRVPEGMGEVGGLVFM